ncbi:glycosyltransferase family 1 protein [Rhodoferax sp.]|uniref:glycosyltransferase family 4 protein n=1 Tax=Rhodoferax sp. TaxID=50421 RepID=UPI0025DB189D|nr:glycosyltransferase family 1 protein [Rhodoferax sp.]
MTQVLQRIALQLLPPNYWRNQFSGLKLQPKLDKTSPHQLLVDVSVIVLSDARTGIQRVVRNIYKQLLLNPPNGYQVLPIAASKSQGYQYIQSDFLENYTVLTEAKSLASTVQVKEGDIFFGLDLAARIVHSRIADLLAWKRQGVRLVFMVYDLLPVLHPDWFNPRNTYYLARWLRTIAVLADDVVCISRTVQMDLNTWTTQKWGVSCVGKTSMASHIIKLGADAVEPSKNETQGIEESLNKLSLGSGKVVLMVGTLEPRKGHEDVLNAFEILWAKGNSTQLVIAGKKGWKIDGFIDRIQNHPELNRRMYWVDSPSEIGLLGLYKRCNGLIMASKGEGFGLPLIEAALHHKPVLARNLPVFREIGLPGISFFVNDNAEALALSIEKWLSSPKGISYKKYVIPTWERAASQLLTELGLSSKMIK